MRYLILILTSVGLLAGCQGNGGLFGGGEETVGEGEILGDIETDAAVGTGIGAAAGAATGGLGTTILGGAAGYGASEVLDEGDEAGPDGGIIE